MLTLAYVLYGGINLVLLALALRQLRAGNRGALLVLGLGIAALIYDNLVIGLGHYLGEGPALQSLNLPRFWLHAFVTPLFGLVGLWLARNAAVEWAWSRKAALTFGTLTALIIALGAYYDVLLLQMAPVYAGETVRYKNAATAGPPLPALKVMMMLIFCGIGVFIRTRWTTLLVSTVAAFAILAFASSIGPVANLGEICMVLGLVLTARRFPAISRAEFAASQHRLTPNERAKLADDQRGRKRRLAVYNRYLAWVMVPTLLIGTLAYYQRGLGIALPGWMNSFFNTLFIVQFFVHATASLYFYGVPRPKAHIRVAHVYIGYGVFLFTMVSQSLLGVEPIHMITYVVNWLFILAHLALSVRFMLQRVRRKKQDPLLDFVVSKKLLTDSSAR